MSADRELYEINWAFDEYANLCKFIQIKKMNDISFPERGKIDKAQLILDSLVPAKYHVPRLLQDHVALFQFIAPGIEAAHACYFHMKNFTTLSKF